jgi:hypothetical protein
MTWWLEPGLEGRPGRARARRDQILDSSHSVVSETDERLVVRRWMTDKLAIWKKIETGPRGLWELIDDSCPPDRKF